MVKSSDELARDWGVGESSGQHGIAIREKGTKKLIEFIPCHTGASALRVLSGVRRQMDTARYTASEDYVRNDEIAAIER
jgi:hypothetical protein